MVERPERAIDRLLVQWEGQYARQHQGYQVFIKKLDSNVSGC